MTHFKAILALTAVIGLGACSSDDVTGPPVDTTPRQLIDSTSHPGYLILGTTPTLVSGITDPKTSSAWDLSINGLNIAANGGVSGPGDVSVYCICENVDKTDAQILALTQTDGLNAFNAVKAEDIPSDLSVFKTDVEQLAIPGHPDGWWRSLGATPPHVALNDDAFWAIRLASSSGAYAKFRVITLTPTGGPADPASVTIEWAVQASGSTTTAASQTTMFTTSASSPVYVNLSTGTVTSSTTPPAQWDLVVAGYTIRLHASAGAVSLKTYDEGYEEVTSITALGFPPTVFRGDATGGVFKSTPWYRYDINPAAPHQVTMTYEVYLVKKGSSIYKVQVAGYYHPITGNSRNVTVRAQLLR